MSTARVNFTRSSAERIAAAVRRVERGDRDENALEFGRVDETDIAGTGLRRATFKGEWVVGETRTVTLFNSTATANVTNLCVPSFGKGGGDRTVIFGRVAGTNSVVEISGPGDFCGTYQGPDLITLSFEACHGSGAAARVTAPGGKSPDDAGPIGAISVSTGGSGYALKARVEPTLTISGSGTGAAFTTTLSKQTGDCSIPYWEISSVSVSSGGGYVDGEQLRVTPAGGAVAELPANITLATKISEPTITASVAGGSGADLSVTTKSLGGSPETWQVSGIAVNDGGKGYVDRASITLTPAADVQTVSAGAAIARTKRTQPTFAAIASGGFGASLTPVLAETTDTDGRAVWGVSSLTVANGGSGYVSGAIISVSVIDGIQLAAALASVDTVHTATGAIISAKVASGGKAYKESGVVELVSVQFGGIYYAENPDSVKVNTAGRYYLEDPAASPYTTAVTITINQSSPSAGSGAALAAVVETNPASGDFGRVTGVNITSGGTGYLAWQELQDITFQGLSFAGIPGFDFSKQQLLGHEADGCLQWFDTVVCDEEEEPEEP